MAEFPWKFRFSLSQNPVSQVPSFECGTLPTVRETRAPSGENDFPGGERRREPEGSPMKAETRRTLEALARAAITDPDEQLILLQKKKHLDDIRTRINRDLGIVITK